MTARPIEDRACGPERTGTTWRCRNWRTQEGEWYCGHCGLPLPPVAIRLEPDAGRLSGEGPSGRETILVFDRLDQLSYAELGEFVVEVSGSDRRERQWEIPVADLVLWSRQVLELKTPPGAPLDLVVKLRHKDRPGAGEPVAFGHYDYPAPNVIAGSPILLLPPAGEPLSVALTVSPAGTGLAAAQLELAEPPVTLAGASRQSGTGAIVEFALDAPARSLLDGLTGASVAELRLRFHGIVEEIRLELTVARPAALEVRTPDEVKALTGRRARIAAHLGNGGGSAASLVRVGWRILSGAAEVVARGELPDFHGTRVPPGGLGVEFRPWVADEAGSPLAPGFYRLMLECEYRDVNGDAEAVETAATSLRLNVRPDAVYPGLVCIDFGTTDTAAAILPPGRTYFDDPKTGLTPQPIELGPASFADRSAGRYFIPTQVAIGLDSAGAPTMLFAEEAVQGFAALERGRLVDRLKWQLGQGGDAPDVEEFGSIEDLVAGYLAHVRCLIEEHPEVAGRVEKVIATRPARFGELREAALIAAFRRAGMEVDLTRFGDKARPMVSESWPPVLLMLPIREDPVRPASTRLLAQLRAVEPNVDFPVPLELAAVTREPHYLCIFDIGGGSSDVSLVRLTKKGRFHAADQWTYTDDNFAGEGIRDLLVGELRTTARHAGTSRNYVEDLEALRGVAAALQFSPAGPFDRVSSTFFGFAEKVAALGSEEAASLNRQLDSGESMLPLADEPASASPEGEAAALLVWLHGELENYVQPSFGYFQKIGLPLGGRRKIELSGDVLHDLMIRTFFRFLREFEPRVRNIYAELQSRLRDTEPGNVRMLMTGRGSAFALNEPLIRHVAAAAGSDTYAIHRAPGASAKAVTSWGALGIYASRRLGKVLEFEGLSGSYALCATDFFSRTRVGAVPLVPIGGESDGLYGVPFHAVPTEFDPCLLTIGEDLGPRQESDIYARLHDFGIDLPSDRIRWPAGGIVFDPKRRRVFSTADYSNPLNDRSSG